MRIVILATMMGAAVPAIAMAADKPKPVDQNEVICRSEPIVGSRLATQRTCLTRQQWKQQQEEQRRTVDRIQTQGLKGN